MSGRVFRSGIDGAGMRRWMVALMSGFMLMNFATLSPAQTSSVETAQRVTEDLIANRIGAVVARFTPEIASALPQAKLQESWSGIVAEAGPAQAAGVPRTATASGMTVVTVPVTFQHGALDVVVTVTADGKVAGLFVRPAEQIALPWSPPAYVDRARFADVEVEVGAAPWLLQGTLSLPTGAARAPAVVLVHGSGPHDRNEQIGPNRVFQDLAEGLASRGIAVLRYEKRTRTYGARIAALTTATVREETIDDALAAVALLQARPEVDAGRIVVVGHSLGAMLAPRIAEERPDLAAIVMLAGVSRSLPQLIVDQVRYIAALNGPPDEQAKARIAALEAEAAKAMAARPGDADALILGVHSAYWADLNRYDVAAAAQKLSLPILLLHGGRDYQVTARDHAALVSALGAKPNVTAQEFPELNHLFMIGKGPGRPEEYQHAGHVDQAVVDAIAAFVMKAPAR